MGKLVVTTVALMVMTKGLVFMKDFKVEYKRRGLDCLVKDGGRNPGVLYRLMKNNGPSAPPLKLIYTQPAPPTVH